MSKSSLQVSDFTKEFNESIAKFKNDAVLVGIPAAETERSAEQQDEQPINNAALLAINEYGVEELNIPPRPVMAIGIRAAAEDIAKEFKKAAQNVLTKGMSALEVYYERAGIIASTSVKKTINSQTEIDAPSEATLKARKAAGFKGTKALIVTGQMRNAITYVINKGGF